MLLGCFFRKTKLLNEDFVKVCNKFNFKVTLPVLLFNDIAQKDIASDFDLKYVLFCAGATTAAFFGIWGLSKLFIKERSSRGAFVQASYRSSAAVLGAAFIQNIYGNSGMAPLMIIGSVPLFNIYAVTVLTFEGQSDLSEKTAGIKKAFFNILKNPIIIAIFLGIISSLLGIKYPVIIEKTLTNISALATPLALIAMGAGFKLSGTLKKIKLVSAASIIKLIVLPGIFLPIAAYSGYGGEKLTALIIMLGSPTTPSAYIMAENMGGDGELTSGTVMLTTLLSSVTLTFWIFLYRQIGCIA